MGSSIYVTGSRPQVGCDFPTIPPGISRGFSPLRGKESRYKAWVWSGPAPPRQMPVLTRSRSLSMIPAIRAALTVPLRSSPLRPLSAWVIWYRPIPACRYRLWLARSRLVWPTAWPGHHSPRPAAMPSPRRSPLPITVAARSTRSPSAKLNKPKCWSMLRFRPATWRRGCRYTPLAVAALGASPTAQGIPPPVPWIR